VDLGARIEGDFARRDSGALAAAFRRWRGGQEALRRFADIEELVAACRAGDGSWEAADAALAALCLEARTGDEDAAALLLWLLLPGLLTVRARLAVWRVLDPEDLDAELLAGLWEGAAAVDPSTHRVATRLLNAARWRALAALREAIDWTERTEELGPEVAASKVPATPGPEPGDVLAEAVREGVLSREDLELVLATRGAMRDISGRLGVSLRAAQSRRHRARERLRAWLGES
jgi:DNA-directed RNA polymerase specialized sigma24 family protein